MELPAQDGIDLILYAFEQENEDKIFERWVGLAQYDMSYDEFKEKLKVAGNTAKPTDDVLEDVGNILNSMR